MQKKSVSNTIKSLFDKPKEFLSTFKFREWVPFFQNHGESLVEVLNRNNINPYKWKNFYDSYGVDECAILEKCITEYLRQNDISKMNPNQIAYLGHDMLVKIRSQLTKELEAIDEIERRRKELEKEKKENKA